MAAGDASPSAPPGSGGAVMGLPDSDAWVLVVDEVGTAHQLALAALAASRHPNVPVVWLAPGLDLPMRLGASTQAAAVALPLTVQGAGSRDRFARDLTAACAVLARAGVAVFWALEGPVRAQRTSSTAFADRTARRSASAACLIAALSHAHQRPRREAPPYV